ncbi:MAG: kelch-like protein 18, partial [Candidatus Poribacteria bacterium]|nr:kelch-like protein 18 [Candidatus Poribacteria bacterium]
TFPTVKELPWGVSLLTGIIATILILNPIPISINLMDTPFYSPLPTDTQVLKIGEIPVDVVKASNLPFISSTMGKGNGDEPNPQNTFFMAPKGEGGEWKQKGDMPIPRTGTCSAVINGKIYVIGGSIIAAGVPVSIVEEYDPIKDTWTRKADMPTPRFLATAAVVEDKIYVIGGGQSLVTFLNTLEEYNPAIDKWTAKADMPTQRGCLDAEAVNGKIYAIGGYTANNAFGMGIVEEYDPKMDTWKQKADLNVPRYAISTSIVDGKIYAIGGSQGPSLSTVELYDPAADKWEIKKPMPTTREYLSTAVVDNKIYAFGGMNGNIAFDGIINVEMYDPKTDTWTIEPNMPEPNVAFSCESVDQRIYIIGGESFFTFFGNNPLLPSVREYNPLGLKENPVYPKGKLPSTWGERKLIK